MKKSIFEKSENSLKSRLIVKKVIGDKGMILDNVQSSLTNAMKSGTRDEVGTLRMVIASLHNEKIERKGDLTDKDSIKVLKRELKKRDEAAEAYRKAGRTESAEAEENEMKIIKRFLPASMSDETLARIIDEVLMTSGDTRQFGPLMQKIMAKTDGEADGKKVSKILQEKLRS